MLCFLFFNLSAANAFASSAISEKPSYSIADVACARLSAYGILKDVYAAPQPETNLPISRPDCVQLLYNAFGSPTTADCPFLDVSDKYKTAITWAYEQKITSGVGAQQFGTSLITKDEFLSMLSRCIAEIENEPVGLSQDFTLGDAAIYICAVLEHTETDANIPTKLSKLQFPAHMVLSPKTVEEAEEMIKIAVTLLPDEIEINRSGGLSEEELFALFQKYREYEWNANSGQFTEDIWLLECTSPDDFFVTYEKTNQSASADEYNRLLAEYKSGKMDATRFVYEVEVSRARIFGTNNKMTISIGYNDAWRWACNADDAFTDFQSDELLILAEQFYENYIKPYENESTEAIILAAKKAICSNCVYDYAEESYARSGSSLSNNDAHSINGFFKNGKLVCDGYAKIFHYLMIRADIPCVDVYGSISGPDKGIDHAWNKVKIDEKWYNIDVCWADTGHGDVFDLKSDEYMQKNRHWAYYFLGGKMAANCNY